MTCDEVCKEIEKRTGKKPMIKFVGASILIGVQQHYGNATLFSSLPIADEYRPAFVDYVVGLSGGILGDPQRYIYNKDGEVG